MTAAPEPRALLDFVGAMRELAGRRLWVVWLLLVSGAATEGMGLLLLVPLLDSLGMGQAPASPGPADGVARLLAGLGIPPRLEILLLALLGLIAVRAWTIWLQATRTAALSEAVTRRLRVGLFEAVARVRWIRFVGARHSDYLQALTVETHRAGSGAIYVVQIMATTTLLLAYLAVAVGVAPFFTAVAVLVAGSSWGLLRGRIRRAEEIGKGASGLGRQMFSAGSEHLAGLKLARSLGAEARSIERFREISDGIGRNTLHFARHAAGTRRDFTLLTGVLLTGFVWAGVSLFGMGGAELTVVVVVFARAAPRITQIEQNLQGLHHSLPAWASVRELEARCVEDAEGDGDENLPVSLGTGLVVEGAWVRYAEGPWVLEDVSLDLPAGSATALVGPSGAGKSTLADLVLGLLVPERGAVVVGDISLDDRTRPAWRRRVGYVPQDPFFLHDTVRANLAWAAPDASEAAMWEALTQAAVAGVVEALPRGLDTMVGERGARLSGGERQRLSIARALLRRPSLLVLDEPTSQLDAASQDEVGRVLASLAGRVTILIISHRPEWLGWVDEVVTLEGGRVREAGAGSPATPPTDQPPTGLEGPGSGTVQRNTNAALEGSDTTSARSGAQSWKLKGARRVLLPASCGGRRASHRGRAPRQHRNRGDAVG